MGTLRSAHRASVPVGMCALLLSLSAMAPRAAGQTPIACGQVVQASISTPGEIDTYAFAVNAGDVGRIDVTMPSDTYIYLDLYAPNGQIVERVANYSAAKIETALTSTGIYTLVVAFRTTETGAYNLVWQRLNNPCNTRTLNCGQPVADSITRQGQINFYTLQGNAGDVARIDLTMPSNPYIYLDLYAPNGQSVERVASNSAAKIVATLASSGIYTLVVAFRTTETGAYNLVWQRLNNPCNTRSLSCGQSVADSIGRQGQINFYTLQGNASDVVRIDLTMPSNTLIYLDLYGPNGQSVERVASYSAAKIETTLASSGIHTLVVAFPTTETGAYNLVWQRLNRPCISISFSVSPSSLSFSAPAGSTPTAPQQLELRSDFPGLPWRATVRIQSGAIWLPVSSDFGQMPAAIQVTADATNLSAGTYQGTIEILAPDASPPSQTISVTFTVGSGRAPSLTVDPGTLSFGSVLGEPLPPQALRIGNSGTGTLSWRAESRATTGNWLSVSPLSGLASAGSPATLQVTVNAGGLTIGSYSGTILVSSADTNQTVSVAVSLSVSSNDGVLLLSQSSLLFRAVEGGGADPPQTVGVLNIGGGAVDWSAETVVGQSVSWLRIAPSSGRSVAGSTTIPQTTISVDPTGLTAGFYVGTIRFTAAAANNSPQTLRVDLHVLSRGTALGAVVRPTGLIFVGAAGGAAPPAQEISVATSEAGPVEFISAPVGGAWVSRTPDSGNAARTTPGRTPCRLSPPRSRRTFIEPV